MIEKHTRLQCTAWLSFAVFATAVAVPCLSAQSAQQPAYGATGSFDAPTRQLTLPPLPQSTPITPNGTVVEDVIARVNDQIITRTEYERSEQQMLQEAQQQNVPESELDDRLHNLLRDMIDQQLLLSKGKELGITGDAEMMRQLDDIRKQNHLDSMEALEKAAEQQGISFEDFKQRIRNEAITQQVVGQEVGRRLNLTHADELAYYNAHGKDFAVPEQVHLSEILIPTPENPTDAQITAAQQKADETEAKLKGGANFADVAKSVSGGPTASAGGDLGDFKRGALGDVLEKATFSLPAGGVTEPIRTRQGFVILRVDSHQAAGVPPLSQVEPQVEQAIYLDRLQPALRAYLTKAREDAYVDIKPGFVDTGSDTKESKPVFTSYAPPAVKKKVLKKERLEQERAERAQENLAAAREKLAAKQAAKSTAKGGVRNVSAAGPTGKRHKIHREKIRFGEAPRKALPNGTVQTSSAAGSAAALGQPAGAVISPAESVTTITTGTGFDETAEETTTAKPESTHKTRFTSRESESTEKRAQRKVAKAEVKASERPAATTAEDNTTEKVQAAPLGLNGDTGKHKHEKTKTKTHHSKDEPKERLQEKTKPVETPAAPPAPTVNPNLGAAPVGGVPATTNGATPQ